MYTGDPPFTVTASILNRITRIAELTGRSADLHQDPVLQQISRIRAAHASLSLEGCNLSLELAASVLTGKLTPAPDADITKLKNIYACYESPEEPDPCSPEDLKRIHGILAGGIDPEAGCFRTGPAAAADRHGGILHYGLPPDQIEEAVSGLLNWVRDSGYPMLVKSCVFSYEFIRILPFSDCCGSLGRLWQILLLGRWNRIFARIPIDAVLLERQEEYDAAIRQSNRERTATAFVDFLLSVLEEALLEDAQPQGSIDSISTAALRWYKISRFLKKNGTITNADVRQLLQVSAATANRILAGLTEEEKIQKIRMGKSWGYVAV